MIHVGLTSKPLILLLGIMLLVSESCYQGKQGPGAPYQGLDLLPLQSRVGYLVSVKPGRYCLRKRHDRARQTVPLTIRQKGQGRWRLQIQQPAKGTGKEQEGSKWKSEASVSRDCWTGKSSSGTACVCKTASQLVLLNKLSSIQRVLMYWEPSLGQSLKIKR